MILTTSTNTSAQQNAAQIFGDSFASPLLNEIRDPIEVTRFFNKFGIVPFFGDRSSSSDRVLRMIYSLFENVPMASATVGSIANFTVGGGFVLKEKRGLLKAKTQKVSEADELAFNVAIEQHLSWKCDLQTVAENAAKSLTIDGNAFLLLTIEKLSKTFSIDFVPSRKVRYKLSKETVIIANSFVPTDMISVEPIELPVYPETVQRDGVLQTVIHLKAASPSREYYGLSSGTASLLAQNAHFELIKYLSNETKNRFSGQVFLDVEKSSSDEVAGFGESLKHFVDTLRDYYTNRATDPKSVLMRARANGTTPTAVTQFAANTNHEFYRSVVALLNEEILTAYSWTQTLINGKGANALSGQQIKEAFMLGSYSVNKLQHTISAGITDAIFLARDVLQFDGVQDKHSIELQNLYQQLLQDEAEAASLLPDAQNQNQAT